MKIRLIRTYHPDFTLSECLAYYNGDVMFSGYAVEPPWKDNESYVSCVPEGTYEAFTRENSDNGNVIQLKDVPDRTGIQFHIANWAHELEGCIAPGMGQTGDGVSDSATAMRKLYDLALGQDVKVEIMSFPDYSPPDSDRAEMDGFLVENDWTIDVSHVDVPDAFDSLRESLIKRFERRNALRVIFNAGISILMRVSKVPELKHLKLEKYNMDNLEKNLQKIMTADGWEAVVWGAVTVLGLVAYFATGQVELLAASVGAGLKSGFQTYKAKK